MPPEPKIKSLKRRGSSRRDTEEFRFDGGHARELELKRSRGEVSCAECRRLKIKCDKQIPCTSCQRRGCAALCPNGSLATGQGTRFVLAATEHLHKRIARLSTRVRQLEDALATIHSKYAPEDQQPHPLLDREWNLETDGAEDDDELEPGSNRGRKIGKLPPGVQNTRAISMGASDSDAMEEGPDRKMRRRDAGHGGDVIDAFGTLSISDHGISRFFGPTGGSESLLIANLSPSDSSTCQTLDSLRKSSSPTAAASAFPSFESENSMSPATTHSSQMTSGTACTSNATQTSATSISSASITDARLALFSHHFPFTPLAIPPPQIQSLIESYLPSYERARELVDVYYSQVAWIFRGVSREQLDDEMLSAIYSRKLARDRGEERTRHEEGYESDEGFVKQSQRDPSQSRYERPVYNSSEDYSGPHDLALLFIVFAVGAIVESPSLSSSSQPNSPPHPVNSPSLSSPTSASAADSSRTPKPSPTALAEHYHQLSRAALSLQAVLEKPSIVTIQTLHLLSIYNAMSGEGTNASTPSSSASTPGADGGEGTPDNCGSIGGNTRETSMEMTWSLITMAAHLSQTIGLHRDSERWGLSPKMVQRRRILFWDLFVADVWQSLNTGRPPSFSLAYIDCSFPQYEGINVKEVKGVSIEKGKEKDNPQAMDNVAREREKAEKAKKEGYAFEIWQFRFAAECVADVVSRTLTAEAPTYATIMELDRKVREFPLPEGFSDRGTPGSSSTSVRDPGLGGVPNTQVRPGADADGQDTDLSTSFMRCVLEHIRETILMYIHRSFFAQAIIEQPVNPLKSVYAPSFLAAYRAAATILKSVREQFSIWPTSCARFWTMWTFAFSAAVVFGTVVTRGPHSPLASSAMTELEQACILFSKAAMYSKRATRALPILTTLREKARCAIASGQTNDPTLSLSSFTGSRGELWNIKREENDLEDELSIFAGHTRFVSSKNRSITASAADGNGGVILEPTASVSGPSLGPVQGPSGIALNETPGMSVYGQADSAPRHRRQVQPSREYGMDSMDMDLDHRVHYDSARAYEVQRHHDPAYPGPASHVHQQVPSQRSISLGDSSGWYEQNSHPRRESYSARSHLPPPSTISIPPAPMSSSIEDHSPHNSHMNFSYSYDRSSRHAAVPPPSAGYSTWSSQEQPQYSHPPRHSSSPVRLAHPQYGPLQSQMQPPIQSYHPRQHSTPQHEMYTGPGAYGPPPPLHAVHGQGNAALADLGLASRDSRLDERWSSFMQDSGLLDSVNEANFGRGGR